MVFPSVLGRCHESLHCYSVQHLYRRYSSISHEKIYSESMTCHFVANYSLKMGMRKVGCWDRSTGEERHCRIWTHLTNSILMSSLSFSTIVGEKCANINMPLKERWLGMYRGEEALLTRGWSRSNSFSPLGNKVLFSFLTWPSRPCY